MKILIVEDEQSSAKLIKKTIVMLGHTVEVVGTGKSALKIVKQINFDLVLLDIFLPDYHGADLIPQFKSIRYNMGVIAMAGHNSRELELKVRGLGILYYLIKPFDISYLETILNHLKNKKLLEKKPSQSITGLTQTDNETKNRSLG